MSRLEEKINARDEINPLENDNNLVKVIHKCNIINNHIYLITNFLQYKYSPISPNYSSDNEISSIQKNDDISILAKVIYKISVFK